MKWLCAFMVVGVLFGCGGGGGGDNDGGSVGEEGVTAPADGISRFQLTAPVAEILGEPPFEVSPGDEIVMTFSYAAQEPGTQADKASAATPQELNVALNGRSQGTDTSETGICEIVVVDGAEPGAEDRITLTFSELSSAAEAGQEEAGLEEFRVELSLVDTTGQVFSGQALPRSLDLHDFDSGHLEISTFFIVRIKVERAPVLTLDDTIWSISSHFEDFSLTGSGPDS